MPTPIAVDWGLGEWPGLEAQHLISIRYAPVLSPTLARSSGGIEHPSDLARLPIIHQQERVEWAAWLELVGATGVKFSDETIIDDSNMALQAAIDGQGVILGIFPFVQGEIDAGRLIKPFQQDLAPARAYHLLTKPGARRRPQVAAICDWLVKEAAAYQSAQPSVAAANPRTTVTSAPSATTAHVHPSGRAERARGKTPLPRTTAAPTSPATPSGRRSPAIKSGKRRRRPGATA
jgi:hypothetical protein